MKFAGDPQLESRTVIDVAVGILVGVRGCSQHDAFSEIAQKVHQSGVPLSRVAAALVAMASPSDRLSREDAARQHLWGELQPLLPGSGHARIRTRR
jgi:hypothetical protein